MDKLKILLVEDNLEDAFLIKEALEDQQLVQNFNHVINGEEAIRFLKKQSPYESEEIPDLILMDINMPVMTGLEALHIIKKTENLKHIPVLILTTSDRKEDILKAYRNYTSSYLVKPDDIFQLDDLTSSIKEFWGKFSKIPRTT